MEAAGLVSDVAIPRARAWPRLDLKWVAIAGAVALVAWLALVPLVFLLWQSFLTPETASAPAQLTLENYRAAYSTAETLHLFANSLAFACGAALLSFVLGATFAFINERTDTPCKSLFFGLAVIPLVIPSVLFTVAWILLASPKIGLINLALQGWLGTDAVFVNVYSLGGMIFVDGLHYSPMAFLLMTAALRAMDPALEESALMSGASALQVARRITLGLVWPAVVASLLILFVRAIESFEVPALLGLPVGIEVYTSAIYQAVHKYPSEVGLACAYAVTLLLIAALCISMQSRLSSRAEHFATVTGKGFRPRALAIGRWRYLTASLFVLYFAVIVLLPFLVLVWSSLQKFYRVPSLAALGTVSLDAYRSVLDFPSVGTAVWNSILLSFGAATIIMLATSVLCWVIVRTRMPGRWSLDSLASLPLAVPGLVLGLAIMICYLTIDIGVYGTLAIMLIAYVTRFMPYGMRYNSVSMLQLHKELEESAALSGASWATIFRRIVLPLLKPGLIAGWIYVVIVSVRELSSSILLYSPGTEVVSIVIWELWQNGQYVELSALGVMLIGALFVLVMAAQVAGRRFGIVEAWREIRKEQGMARNAVVSEELAKKFATEKDTPYTRWVRQEGLDIIGAHYVPNLHDVALKSWPRRGGRGVFINHEASRTSNDCYVCEIPPGGKLAPQRQLYEEMILVLDGRGSTSVWNDAGARVTFEWKAGALFAIPLNASHQHFNGSGREPARYVAVTNAPSVINLYGEIDFVFNTPRDFLSRFSGEPDYFSDAGEQKGLLLDTNFVADAVNLPLVAAAERGAGGGHIRFNMAKGSMNSHISQFPVGTYKKAHAHGPGAHVIILGGEGFSLMWPEGDEPRRYDWQVGAMIVPPNMWFHQHFNTGTTPARYLAFKHEGVAIRNAQGVPKAWISRRAGGDQIDYADEKPIVRSLFADALARHGLAARMDRAYAAEQLERAPDAMQHGA